MEFRISDTFSDSLLRLTGDEQKAIKTTAFDLQMNPANPSMHFHRIERSKDPNFWSIRVSQDIRLILHKTDSSLLLCYVDHHDEAYRWAERRKIERHPKTGAAQLVEVREIIKEIPIPKFVEVEKPQPKKLLLFKKMSEAEFLSFGVPKEWIDDLLVVTEDTLFDVINHLPNEAAEALLEIATGGKPKVSPETPEGIDSFDHPDAKRRFRRLATSEELERALEYPWEKWTVFLHPEQQILVEKEFNGPARISGSAGTGKTIVALHRAVYLAKKNPDARVLFTTFSETLANALRIKLKRLIGNEPKIAERLEIHSIGGIGERLFRASPQTVTIANREQIRSILFAVASNIEHKFSDTFLWNEWHEVVDDWRLLTWEDYRNVQRLGRKRRLSEAQRKNLWAIFHEVRGELERQALITRADMFHLVAKKLQNYEHPPFDYAVIDEAQDLSVAELKVLAALGKGRPNALFFTGDLGQRIFQQPFSWKSLGVEIRGRSQTLRVNYRTSHEIRSHADRLLPSNLSDVDGNEEIRGGTVSVFQGVAPEIQTFQDANLESQRVGQWVSKLFKEGYVPHEIGIFVRSPNEMERAHKAIRETGAKSIDLTESVDLQTQHISVCPMHLAKGLEFRAVAVMACDDDVIPQQERIETVSDESDLDEVYQTERHLLYVACTRARDRLLVTGVEPASEFLDDLRLRGEK